MENEKFSREEAAEEMRKKHHYRQLILTGRLVLPYQSAARLLGPDCLYHLYSTRETEAATRKPDANAQKGRPRRRRKTTKETRCVQRGAK